MKRNTISNRSPRIRSILGFFPKNLLIGSSIVIIIDIAIFVAVYLFRIKLENL